MKVIVCGAGQVGFNIARHLAFQQNDVTVIDRSGQLIRQIADTLDVKAIQGNASDPNMLQQAGATESDMIIAVTVSDEVNIVACQVAHSLFNVPTKIARIRNQNYLRPQWSDLFSRDHMPIDVIISPEVELARSVYRRLEVPGAFDMIPFADGRVRVVGVKLQENCPVLHTPLRQLTELFPDLNIMVLGIVRGDKTFVPSGDDHMEEGDEIYFSSEGERVARAMAAFGHDEKTARRVIIVGGGNVGMFLAKELEQNAPRVNVKIIERNAAQAEFIANKLSKTVVINGDGLDVEILKEANIAEAETLVAVANDDEVNILASLLAKRQGCPRVITLLNNPIYGTLTGSLGIDVYLDPRETTVSTILQHIRRGRIRGLHSIRSGSAEIIEAEALESSNLVGKTIRSANLPDGILIGAIVRGDDVIIPHSDTEFEAGDRVIIFALTDAVKKIEQLFSVRLEFF